MQLQYSNFLHSDILISEGHNLIPMKSVLKIKMITSTTG